MRIAILLFLAAVLAGLGWWFVGTGAPTAAPTDMPTGENGAAERAHADDSNEESAERPAAEQISADRTVAQDTARSGAEDAPDDAKWVEVTVRDFETTEPVADAEVWWTNSTQAHRVARERSKAQFSWFQEPHRMARELGWKARSDAQGKVRVWFTQPELVVTASKDQRFGVQFMLPGAAEDLTVYLEPDEGVRVRVVDANGEPAHGVVVGLKQRNRKEKPQPYDAAYVQRMTDGDGVADFAHIQSLRMWRPYGNTSERADIWEFDVVSPGEGCQPVAVDAHDPPEDPVELRLPGTGHLRVRLTVGDRPVSPAPGLELKLEDDQAQLFRFSFTGSWPDGNGVYEWRHVALGQNFAIASEGWRIPVAGPARDGEAVLHQVRLEDHCVIGVGRLLDADGSPVAHATLTCHRGDGAEAELHPIETDAEGRLAWILPVVEPPPAVAPPLRLVWQRRDEPTQVADLGRRVMSRGRNDFGEIRMRRPQLGLSGRVVVDRGDAVGAYLRFDRFQGEEAEPDNEEAGWRPLFDVHAPVANDGTFACYREFAPGRYRVHVDGNGFLESVPVVFAPGATNLELHVIRSSRLTASCILPEGMQGGAVEARLFGSELPAEGDRGRRPSLLRAPRTRFLWPELPSGTYALELRQAIDDRLLTRIDGIELPGGAQDPRLDAIDLRNAMTTTRVHVATRAEAVEQLMLFPQPQTGDWSGTHVQLGDNLVVLPEGTKEVLVAGPGLRPARAPVQDGAVEISLDAWPTAEIVVVGLDNLPKDARIAVRTAPAEQENAPATEGPDGWLRTDASWSDKLPHRLPMDGRTHDVDLMVYMYGVWNMIELNDFTPKQVRAPGRVELVVPPAEAARVRAELLKK